MTSEATFEGADLSDPDAVLAGTDWASLEHAYGPAEDTPKMLLNLLDDDQQVRSHALDHLHYAVHHQNTLYSATVPSALYVAAILADPRTATPVDKRPHDFPGPLKMELLGWLGSIAHEADDETEAISRRHGFAPEDYPPILHVRQIRPALFGAVSACIYDQDLNVREAAIAACVPLLDDPQLRHHRADLAPLVREVLGASMLWQYRERAIDALNAWGEDSTGLEGQQETFAVCDPQVEASPWSAESTWKPGDTSDLPF
ncbi:hypothetical protein [Streptomyces sp. NBC_00401]|uniref:hypothetical protein n=1 Tax=Streptomyces sp. NBC_00401 TaxID=2975738 RepID=UPI002259D508|nr:hypothetical protein [Streptomyces sp. NBC_00401]MCX5081381.1 hypothetical protein [Streptomyces sp. NBC_00401]